MASERIDPIRPTTDEARALARSLLYDARHGALGVIKPDTGSPMVSRVAVGWDGEAALVLVSTLAHHTRGLLADPASSLLVGEPGPKGDPLTHPRVTLMTSAERADKVAHRDSWLASHPKAALYYDFADFLMIRLVVRVAHLNGGFGKAFRLTPDDLRGPPSAA
ncbi:pyridoxamine 5-phosphate oxidase [Rubellimicrobium rubrum]|uniref:Pyridoxamine 5-phosphate oxidase n=1 Tax=Rubellimicrobium rubrum TaxID=2585369 RepID=A0A5C4MWL7_9RHOB|nr:pyridoxamine 5-phosphate oxidase [Rubellimicrobium rubrum]TNC48980.1 pyridoxamine 5-phosphate oxidase [Rubellimicrobium rubrum]